MDKNTGVLPMGFKMAKKPINTVVNSKITSDSEFIGCAIWVIVRIWVKVKNSFKMTAFLSLQFHL